MLNLVSVILSSISTHIHQNTFRMRSKPFTIFPRTLWNFCFHSFCYTVHDLKLNLKLFNQLDSSKSFRIYRSKAQNITKRNALNLIDLNFSSMNLGSSNRIVWCLRALQNARESIPIKRVIFIEGAHLLHASESIDICVTLKMFCYVNIWTFETIFFFTFLSKWMRMRKIVEFFLMKSSISYIQWNIENWKLLFRHRNICRTQLNSKLNFWNIHVKAFLLLVTYFDLIRAKAKAKRKSRNKYFFFVALWIMHEISFRSVFPFSTKWTNELGFHFQEWTEKN